MNYLMACAVSMLICVTGNLQSMNRYQQYGFADYVRRYIFPVATASIEAMSLEDKNKELAYQSLLAFKQFEVNRSKPTLYSIMRLVRYGASADCQICLREKNIERRFTPLYLALVANSVEHARELLEKGAQPDIVWSVSTIAKTDRPFYYSALQVAESWCNDSGEMKELIRSYEVQRRKKSIS